MHGPCSTGVRDEDGGVETWVRPDVCRTTLRGSKTLTPGPPVGLTETGERDLVGGPGRRVNRAPSGLRHPVRFPEGGTGGGADATYHGRGVRRRSNVKGLLFVETNTFLDKTKVLKGGEEAECPPYRRRENPSILLGTSVEVGEPLPWRPETVHLPLSLVPVSR